MNRRQSMVDYDSTKSHRFEFPKNLDVRPQTVCRQFLTVQFTLGSRPKRAGNNTMNTENEEKAKKKVIAMEVQKIPL